MFLSHPERHAIRNYAAKTKYAGKKLRRIGDTQTEAIALSTVKSELAVVVLFSAWGQRVDPHRNHQS